MALPPPGLSGRSSGHLVYYGDGQNFTGSLVIYLVSAAAAEVLEYDIIYADILNKQTSAELKSIAEDGFMDSFRTLSNAVSDTLVLFGIITHELPITTNAIRALPRDKI